MQVIRLALFFLAIYCFARTSELIRKLRHGRRWSDPSVSEPRGYIGNYGADLRTLVRWVLLSALCVVAGIVAGALR